MTIAQNLRLNCMTLLAEKLGDTSKPYSLEAFEHSMESALNIYFENVAEIKKVVSEVQKLWGEELSLEVWCLEQRDSDLSIDVSNIHAVDAIFKMMESGSTFEECTHFEKVIKESHNDYTWENVKELTEDRYKATIESPADYAKEVYKHSDMDSTLIDFVDWEKLGNHLINTGDHELIDGCLYANS